MRAALIAWHIPKRFEVSNSIQASLRGASMFIAAGAEFQTFATKLGDTFDSPRLP